MTTDADLQCGDIELEGRIMPASNATFVGSIGAVKIVYKPVAGEQPLWDFPDGNLARREVAAYLVSEVLGWDVVPRTWLRDGPMGPGMVQLWQDVDPTQDAVDLVPSDAVPEHGWRHVFDGFDAHDRPVSLIHEDSPELRRMAVFDVITNNADRKGGHVLEMPGGHRYGIDHGLTFHAEHKLRTVLWGWVDEALTPYELEGVERVRAALAGELGSALGDLLTEWEISAFAARCDAMLRKPRFPRPRGHMPAIPWPPF
ncbi:SCO1664 family protein [Aeromicrobium wangtongii]|uniref:SCO1664 family protein n=1 Tax=Aeromicrobium wangtongii TaxID=2969247 RepID=A0ABY5M4U3_9ACTN|nr:SCO1664 family protein [Aeromicrobium wangtongii]MCD9199122.1 SCO1664 family protein [Aeromicrobium wangtongii]UUP12847.1 SCO1664 family protein [Aeromicrobium wangtongii]